mgnify:CR=1 FL=1
MTSAENEPIQKSSKNMVSSNCRYPRVASTQSCQIPVVVIVHKNVPEENVPYSVPVLFELIMCILAKSDGKYLT